MLSRRIRRSLATAGVAATMLVVPSPPDSIAQTGAVAATNETSSIGDTCLVGDWAIGPQLYLSKFHDAFVMLYGLTGATQVNHGSGRSVTTWDGAKPGRGWFNNHRIRQDVRGTVVAQLHGSVRKGRLSFTHAVAHHMTETFTYRGHRTTYHFNGRMDSQHDNYSCDESSYSMSNGSSYRVDADGSPSSSAASSRR